MSFQTENKQFSILGVIPSRYESKRFPGKPLVNIKGKSMVQRVYEQSKQAVCLDNVIIATDDSRIFDHVTTFKGNVMMTSTSHKSGTDRCCEVLSKMNDSYDYIINIQGDEPFIQPKQIELVAECFKVNQSKIATLVRKITNLETLFDPNSARVILNKNEEAIYFTRSTIPFLRTVPKEKWLEYHDYYQHIGIYGYEANTLQQITNLSPSSLEQAEKLEQLRWIENGFTIQVNVTDLSTYGIDTPEDLKKLEQLDIFKQL